MSSTWKENATLERRRKLLEVKVTVSKRRLTNYEKKKGTYRGEQYLIKDLKDLIKQDWRVKMPNVKY